MHRRGSIKEEKEGYPSLFDASKHITRKIWCVTQVAAGDSTRCGCLSCCSCWDAGHSSLIIETTDTGRGIYVFDYRTKPPDEIKRARQRDGYAWLNKKAYLYDLQDQKFQKGEQYTFYYEKLTPNQKQTWACDASAVRGLLKIFDAEYEAQEREDFQPKSYSLIWENCHFLIAEKLATYQEELDIHLFTPDYIKKFHMGGWKYSMLFSMPTSILFATLLASLYSIFERLALTRTIQIDFIGENSTVTRSLSFTPTAGTLKHLSFLGAEYLLVPTTLIYVSSNLMLLFMACCTLKSACSSVQCLSVSYGLLSSAALSIVSFVVQSYLSPIEDWQNYKPWLWTLEEVSVPVCALAGFIVVQTGLPYLLYLLRCTKEINQEQSLQVINLMEQAREARVNRLNIQFAASIIPFCGMLAKAISRTPINEYIHTHTLRSILSPLFFLSYPVGCIVGWIVCYRFLQPKAAPTSPLTYTFFKSVLMYLGLSLPSFLLISHKINYIQDHHFKANINDFPMLNVSDTSDHSVLNVSDSLMDAVCNNLMKYNNAEYNDLCGYATHYLTKTELFDLTVFSLLGYLTAISICFLLTRIMGKGALSFYESESFSFGGSSKKQILTGDNDEKKYLLEEKRNKHGSYQSVGDAVELNIISAKALVSPSTPTVFAHSPNRRISQEKNNSQKREYCLVM